MKRLLIIIMLFISIGAQGQSIIDHLGKIRMRYNNAGSNDTLLIQFNGDSVLYNGSNIFHKFAAGLIADSLKLNGGGGWITSLIPSQWTSAGSNIYYNTGNVGINNASPSYKLDVNGLIAGTNIETNTTSLSTKLGINAGVNEDESNENLNIFFGNFSGNLNTIGTWNIAIGAYANYATTSGYDNLVIGNQAGESNVGNSNTFLGHQSGIFNKNGDSSVLVGNYSRYYGTFSNELVIDNRQRGAYPADSLLYRNRSLVYGTFANDPLDQTLTFNAKTNLHAHSALFGRNAAYNITSTNTWLTLKMDTMCAPVTSSGFEFNADSTGVKVLFNGFVEVSGHAKLLNNAASQQTANIYVRLRLNGNEVTQFNTAVGRTFNANGAHDLVSVTGFIPVSVNDVISVQCRTDNANIDLEQTDGGVFDGSSSFCIFLKEMKFVKTFE